ncbi:MAG: TonB-dependent receptor [Ginsengibacter sp.]
MIKIISLSLLFCLYSSISFCQSSFIKGTIKDSSSDVNTANAVVSILNQKDSTLVAFSRSDKSGNFSAGPLTNGDYLVMITFPKYGDYVDKISLNGKETANLNTVYITQKSKLLAEIIVRQQAIRIKGDTTEFTADSFYVKPNATVEDLLKELPGIQVDKDGKITAQGQQVQKVLVDGEEFFSDDPTIATRNLRADAIDKVQVFDKKSDQAEFTGIDDGQKTKTINLKLKEDAKKGYFGKLSVGGLDQYYNAQALINAFKAKRKLSAFVIASSTDQTGLNFQDASSLGFGGGGNFQIDDGSGAIFITGSGSDEFGASGSAGPGLPESIKGGVHFSNKWAEDKYNAGGNYLFNKLSQRSAGNTFRQNILLDSLYYDRESSEAHSNKMRNSLSGNVEIQLDSSSSLKINANGYIGNTESNTQNNSEALSEENKVVNNSIRNTIRNLDNGSLNTSVLYRKKFKKKGRTISVSLEEKYNESKSDGFLYNTANFFDVSNNTIFKKDTTDQKKLNNTQSSSIGAKATYTEPLSQKSFLEFNYTLNNSNSNQKRLTYNKDISSKYTNLVDSLSNEFKYIYNTHSVGANFRYNAKKYNFSFGGNVANTAFQQTDLVKDTTRKYNYYNFFPRANFNYKFSSFSNLGLNINGSTTQPTIDQLQPITDNSNPLNIVVGNPALKQQFRTTANLTYTNFQILNEQYVFLGAVFNSTADQISNSYTIDALGRRVSKYINTNGNYYFGLYGGFNAKIPKTNIRYNINPNVGLSHNTNFVNGIKNVSNSSNYGINTGIRLNKKEKYEIGFTANPSYNVSKSSISKTSNTNYWIYNFEVNGNFQLPGKIEFGTTVDFNFRQKINAFDNNNNVILWNAYIEKKFFKTDALTLRASINDILDQNKGYRRSIQPYAIEESNYLTFRRYGLITLTYNYNNKGGAGAPKEGGVIRL